jgi:hypothetical protein
MVPKPKLQDVQLSRSIRHLRVVELVILAARDTSERNCSDDQYLLHPECYAEQLVEIDLCMCLRHTPATGDDDIGPASTKHADSGGTAFTPEHVLAPCSVGISC